MLTISENKKVDAREIYNFIGVKSRFNMWCTRAFEFIGAVEGKDFCTKKSESNGGRPTIEYDLTIDCAKEICLLQRTPKSKELRLWLIDLSNQRENLELITIKEAAFAVKVINCLKYVQNQKEVYEDHKKVYGNENSHRFTKDVLYMEFAKYRANLVGWNKTSVDQAINQYIAHNPVHSPSKIKNSNMSTKLSILDTGEAIKVACLDIIYSQHNNENIAERFATLCKNLANEMKIEPEKTREQNLFNQGQPIGSLEEVKNEMKQLQ
jgi:phage anti-repressor protein